MTTDTKHKTEKLDEFSNMQIEQLPAIIPATAQALPGDRIYGAQRVAVKRDEGHVRLALARLAAGAGMDWLYRYPVSAKDEGKKMIEGPSIKLANDVARIYGNNDVDVRVFDLGDSWLFYARFLDIETGYSLTRPFLQSKGQTSIKTKDPERARNIAFQIGVSKAIRNVVVNALQTYADFAAEEASRALVDRVEKKLPHYREKIAERLAELGITLASVERSVGRAIVKWTAADMARVIAEVQAIQDGMASAADTFAAPPDAPAPEPEAESAPAPEPKAKAKPKAKGKAAPTKAAAATSPKPKVKTEKAKPAAASPAPPQTVLMLRTQMFKALTKAALQKLWNEKVEPCRAGFDAAEWAQLEKTYNERLDAARS